MEPEHPASGVAENYEVALGTSSQRPGLEALTGRKSPRAAGGTDKRTSGCAVYEKKEWLTALLFATGSERRLLALLGFGYAQARRCQASGADMS